MGLKSVWKNYRVLIVMGTGLGLVHWGWYQTQFNPAFNPKGEVPPILKHLPGKDRDEK